MMSRAKVSVLLLTAVTLLLAACGGGGSVQSVQIESEGLRLAPGGSAELTATVQTTGTASEEVEWSSSDEGVATVDSKGVVSAVEAGDAEISAGSVADERRSDSVTVTVLAPPADAAVPAGEASASVGSTDVTPGTSVTAGKLAVTVGDAELLLGLLAGDGEELPVHAGGLPRVTADGAVNIQGSGYAPGSPVDVWFFSEPVLLGSVATDAAGEFEASYDLPTGLEAGLHTLVVEGLNGDDEALTLRVGIEVEAAAAITEFAHCPANTDWYVSSERGDDEALGSTISAPIATMQLAVDEAEDGDVVCVAAGTYALDNSEQDDGVVVFAAIDKPITLVGPNVGVAGAADRRPEAKIIVSNSADYRWYGLRISSDDVTVDGFYISTETPKLDPAPDVAGGYGIWVGPGATSGVTVRNNHVVDMNFPIWVNRGDRAAVSAASGFVIENNFIEGSRAASDQGLMVQGAGAEVRDNVVRDARVGLQIQPYNKARTGMVEGNDFEAFQVGIWFNGQRDPESRWVFKDNTVIGVPSPWGWPLYTAPDHYLWAGIRIEAFANGSVSFDSNRIEAGEADPLDPSDVPADGIYLLRQRLVTGGEVDGIGTIESLGRFFTSNVFPDFGAAGVTLHELSDDNDLIELKAPGQ